MSVNYHYYLRYVVIHSWCNVIPLQALENSQRAAELSINSSVRRKAPVKKPRFQTNVSTHLSSLKYIGDVVHLLYFGMPCDRCILSHKKYSNFPATLNIIDLLLQMVKSDDVTEVMKVDGGKKEEIEKIERKSPVRGLRNATPRDESDEVRYPSFVYRSMIPFRNRTARAMAIRQLKK